MTSSDQTPYHFIDGDGNLWDTDLDNPTSAKGKETSDILTGKFGIALTPEEFAAFYTRFNAKTAGTTVKQGSYTLAEMIEQEFGIPLPDKDAFLQMRAAERNETYRSRIGWIGDGAQDSGAWLAAQARERQYLVTNATDAQVRAIATNPRMRIDGTSIDAYFWDRIFTSDMGEKKPSPALYEMALAHARPRPNEYGIVGIAFEDSKSGIDAAKAARHGGGRLFVVGIGSHKTEEQLRGYGADFYAPAMHAVHTPTLWRAAGF